MKDWKVRQEIYHRITKTFRDDYNVISKEYEVIYDEENIIPQALKYFKDKDVGWFYPAKSYVVGICYAKWLEQYFKEDFYEILSDKNLLYGNDPYFISYKESSEIYDKILEQLGKFDDTCGKIPDIKKYFIEEFLLDEQPL